MLACETTEMVVANINFDYSFRNTIPYYQKLPNFSSKRSKIGLLFVFLMQKVQLLMLLHRCAEAERREKPHLILIKNIFWRSASALARPQSQSIEDRRGCYGNGFDCHCYLFPQNRGQSRKDHHSGPTHEFWGWWQILSSFRIFWCDGNLIWCKIQFVIYKGRSDKSTNILLPYK